MVLNIHRNHKALLGMGRMGGRGYKKNHKDVNHYYGFGEMLGIGL